MSSVKKGLGPLTVQEKKILDLVAEAKTNKEIACDLKISPATVKRHLENILRKLKLKNRVEVAVYAVRTESSLLEAREFSGPNITPHGPSSL